jgi:hypothetical protein
MWLEFFGLNRTAREQATQRQKKVWKEVNKLFRHRKIYGNESSCQTTGFRILSLEMPKSSWLLL